MTPAKSMKCEATLRDGTGCKRDALWRMSYIARYPAAKRVDRFCCHGHLARMSQEAVCPDGAGSMTLVALKASPAEDGFNAQAFEPPQPASYYCERHQLGPRPGVVPTMRCVAGRLFGVVDPDGDHVGDELACAVQAMNNAYVLSRYSGETYAAVQVRS